MMSLATTIRPSPTWTPFFRMSWSAAFIVAMSLCSALNSASPRVDEGLFRNASILSASGRSFAETLSLTAASASAVPCIASAWRGMRSFTLALRMAMMLGSEFSPFAAR